MSTAKECQASRAARKAGGVFYTPEPIVDYILGRTLAKHEVVDNPVLKVLDPACGSGNFLVAAYDLLWDKFNDNLSLLQQRYAKEQYRIKCGNTDICLNGKGYWQRENLHYHIISRCLHGADIDGNAVALAKSRLRAKQGGLADDSVTDNLKICDSLVKWEADPASQRQSDDTETKLALTNFWLQKFDYIVGNPPYISFGLKRAEKMPVSQAQYLRRHYPHSAQYKLSYYALFFERSIQALKPGGYLGFITPDSYLLGRYYSKIREYILETCAVQAITLVSSRAFAGVLVGFPVIAVLRKADCRCSSAVTVSRLDREGIAVAAFQYEQEYFTRQVYKRFRLFFHARDKAIIDKIEQTSGQFSDITKIRTGMRSLTVQDEIKSKTRRGETWQAGLTSSRQLLPFYLVYQGDWLDVNPQKLNKGGWDAAVIAGPKILLRQTGDSLIAAVDRSGLYHLNNIHSLTRVQGGVSLEYLACILNSRLMNYYYHTVTLEKGRAMAQIDIETVEKLPLIIDCEQGGTLHELGLKLSKLAAAVYNQQQKKDDEGMAVVQELIAVDNQMNSLVYKIYGLSADEILYIEQTGVATMTERLVKICL